MNIWWKQWGEIARQPSEEVHKLALSILSALYSEAVFCSVPGTGVGPDGELTFEWEGLVVEASPLYPDDDDEVIRDEKGKEIHKPGPHPKSNGELIVVFGHVSRHNWKPSELNSAIEYIKTFLEQAGRYVRQ